MEVPFDFEARKDEDAKALFERMQLEVAAIPGVTRGRHRLDDAAPRAEAVLEVKAEGRALASGEADSASRLPNGQSRILSCGRHPVDQGTRVRGDRHEASRREW